MVMTDKTPIDGEVQQPQRAADGGRLFGAAATFGQFIGFLESGQYDADAYRAFQDLGHGVKAIAIENGGKAKGKMQLTIEVEVEGDAVFLRPSFKVVLPDAGKRPRTIAWQLPDGRFTPNKPYQEQLFGMRDVNRSGEMRDA